MRTVEKKEGKGWTLKGLGTTPTAFPMHLTSDLEDQAGKADIFSHACQKVTVQQDVVNPIMPYNRTIGFISQTLTLINCFW